MYRGFVFMATIFYVVRVKITGNNTETKNYETYTLAKRLS